MAREWVIKSDLTGEVIPRDKVAKIRIDFRSDKPALFLDVSEDEVAELAEKGQEAYQRKAGGPRSKVKS